jgi:hypothetical protein
LELNSYLGTNMLNDKSVAKWLSEQPVPIWYSYNPDLFSYSLSQTSQMAEKVLEWLEAGEGLELISVNRSLMKAALCDKDVKGRVLLLGGFLDHLHTWQSKYALQHNKFPPYFEWPNRLKEVVKQHRTESKRHPQT